MATSIKIDDGLKDRVRILAEQRRRSVHWIMKEAVREYVEREEAKESFKQEAMASWEKYQVDGRHLSGAEVQGWLDGWGTDKESEPPQCHD